MKARRRGGILGAMALLLAVVLQDWEQLRSQILPRPEEVRWLSIPWESSLWRARERAAAEGKPIFLWEMDGNPAGCT